jgi:DNA polymerase-3 subunit chi
MTEIAFYHLQNSPLETVLPVLLEKTLDAGKRALVLAGSVERVEALNALLWSHDPNGWLPHGSAKDGDPEDQPIWLSADQDNANGASFLFLTDGTAGRDLESFERCFNLFDGRDAAAVEAARERWKELKDAGHGLTYWQQNNNGKWEQKDT